MIKCNRPGCGKTAHSRSTLRCHRCNVDEASNQNDFPTYAGPLVSEASLPSFDFSSITTSDSPTDTSSSWDGGGESGGGGASGDW